MDRCYAGRSPATWGNPANEFGFRVERATVTAEGVESAYTAVGTALANVTSFVDTSTVSDTAYSYRVFALNAAGESMSNTATVNPAAYFSQYTVTPTAGMGGAISPSDPQVVAAGGDSPLFAVTPSAGYRLADVVVDGVSVGAVGAYQFTGVDSDHSIWALFAPDTYDIVPSAGPNGSISAATPRSQCPPTTTSRSR